MTLAGYAEASTPKVLFFDLETAPNLAYVWGHYEQNVIRHVQEWFVLCAGYRWAHETRTHVIAQPDFNGYSPACNDDSQVVQALWQLFDQADILVAHNGDRFDVKKANARFVEQGLTPPSPYKTVDTLKVARQQFMFNSNKLGDLATHLGLGGKAPTFGFDTWTGCMAGDTTAWARMTKYCKRDIDLLVSVYLRLRPWMKSHPNLNVFTGLSNCPTCGHHKLMKRGMAHTRTMTYQRYCCQGCGAYSRGRAAATVTRPGVV